MNYSKVLLCALTYFACGTGSVFAQSNIVINSQPVFQQPSVGFQTDDPFTPVKYYNGSVYFVWVDSTYTPWVTQITNGQAVNAMLDLSDYKVQPDGHHRFSLGIDTDGYLHISGDMHNYNALTTSVINPYVSRYQKQQVMYWKSNQPESVANGFYFAGALNPTTLMPGSTTVSIASNNGTAIPGSGWTYPRFFTDNNGVLYFSALMHAFEYGNYPGVMGVGLYQYNTSTQKWLAIGGMPDVNKTATLYNTTFYYEISGVAPDKWFQGYRPNFFFDKDNNMHFTVSANTNTAFTTNNRVIYAVSKDGGQTWAKANGVKIPGLPIRGADGQANIGDIVLDNSTIVNFDANTAVVYDKNGQLAVYGGDSASYGGQSWRSWNGYAWVKDYIQNLTRFSTSFATNGNNNQILFNNSSLAKIVWSRDLNTVPCAYDVSQGVNYPTYTNFAAIDQATYRQSGVIYGVAYNSATKAQTVLRTELVSAPLPAGWTNKSVSLTPPSYASSAGYLNGVFTLIDYGSIIDSTSDNFQFLYQKLAGDCTILARVNSLQPSADGYARAGIMIREDLSDKSKHVSMILAPGNKNKGALFQYRNVSGGSTSNISVANNVNPYWVKLVRAGNQFTSYLSADGKKWTQNQQVTVAMNSAVYVGLANCAYANGYYMVQTTFDNVSVSQ